MMWRRAPLALTAMLHFAAGCSCEPAHSPDSGPPGTESDHSGPLDSDPLDSDTAGPAPVDAHEILGRGLVALPRDGGVFLSWRLLPWDPQPASFVVHRADTVDGSYEPLPDAGAITASSTHTDSSATSGETWCYAVAVDDGPLSRPACATAGDSSYELHAPLQQRSDSATELAGIAPGDVNGDGVLDFVFQVYDPDDSSVPTHVELVLSHETGWASVWRVSTDFPKNGGDQSVLLYDLDRDARAEIFTRTGGSGDLSMLDPEDGSVLQSLPWFTSGGSGFAEISLAFLDDVDGDGAADPQVITQSNMSAPRFAAVSWDGASLITLRDLSLPTEDEDFTDAYPVYFALGTHGLPVADLDGDGADEVLPCGAVLSSDWSRYHIIYPKHCDVCFPADVDPHHAGPELLFGCSEYSFLTRYDGEGMDTLWTNMSSYEDDGWDKGWAMDLTTSHAGLEVAMLEQPQTSSSTMQTRLFTSQGGEIHGAMGLQLQYDVPIDWSDGDGVKEIWSWSCGGANRPGTSACSGGIYARIGDFVGDVREEVVWLDLDANQFVITTNIADGSGQVVTPLADRGYRMAVARMGASGYPTNWLAARSGQDRSDAVPLTR